VGVRYDPSRAEFDVGAVMELGDDDLRHSAFDLAGTDARLLGSSEFTRMGHSPRFDERTTTIPSPR